MLKMTALMLPVKHIRLYSPNFEDDVCKHGSLFGDYITQFCQHIVECTGHVHTSNDVNSEP